MPFFGLALLAVAQSPAGARQLPVAAHLPTVVLERPAATDGCGLAVLVDAAGARRPLTGVAPGLCVRAGLLARLEGDDLHLVVEVSPTAVDPGRRLFVYRLVGERVEPRYLASGSATLRLDRVERLPGAEQDALLLHLRGPNGSRPTWRCAFAGFPLLCEQWPPAPES